MNQILQKVTRPALWLITIIAGLPLLSETVYTPSLPDIARALLVSESWVEYTLTIYLVGFALGILVWGKLSDRHGRRPYILLGYALYVFASYGCYSSTTITTLMFCRFFQAFGASVGSVLAQAITRDAFTGSDLSKVYAVIASALAVFPALGPVIGGWIAQYYGWSFIFLFLIAFGLAVIALVFACLPETHHKENRKPVSIQEVAGKMLADRRVIGFGLLVAACNGMLFSYFAEGPFFLMDILGLTPSAYGMTFLVLAGANMGGGLLSKKLQDWYPSETILLSGLYTILIGALLFAAIVCIGTLVSLSSMIIIGATILTMMIMSAGFTMVQSNSLSLALVNYKDAIGTASSLFGFSYYAIVSVFTFGMGMLHNGTVFPMPLYFLCIAVVMLCVFRKMIAVKTLKIRNDRNCIYYCTLYTLNFLLFFYELSKGLL